MASNPWMTYNTVREYMLDGTLDFNSDTFYMALFTNGSNCNDPTLVSPIYGSLTNEVANTNGYTTGGFLLTSPTLSVVGAVTTWTVGNGVWTATGGPFTCRYAVIYVLGTVNTIVNPLVCFTTLDNTPLDVVVNAGSTLTVQINASGVFTLTGM